jgi:hypothetical protein
MLLDYKAYHKLHLAIIIVSNLFFIGLYCIDMDIICLFILFKHECHAHCLDTNVICYLYTFEHNYCMSIHVFSI